MKVTYCDICGALIKTGDKKYVLGINEVRETEDAEKIEDFQDFIRKYKQGMDRVIIYEICPECKKILEHLFKMRKKERKAVLKEIEGMYKPEANGNVKEEKE